MLQTTEQQQHTAPPESSAELTEPFSASQGVLTHTGDQVVQPESLESIQSLTGEFSSETKRRRRRFWILWGLMTGSLLPIFGPMFFLIPRLPSNNMWLVPALGILVVSISFAAWIPITRLTTRPSRRQEAIIDRLVAGNDIRSISPLMAGIGTSSKSIRGLMVSALISLLPRLQESDTAWLTDTDQRGLLALVRFANSAIMRRYYGEGWDDLVAAALIAIGEVGDSRALGPVTALAMGNATAGARQRILQAAIACVEPLQRRIERESVGQHLLRSSTEPQSNADTLLIPAVETRDGDVRELPRVAGIQEGTSIKAGIQEERKTGMDS